MIPDKGENFSPRVAAQSAGENGRHRASRDTVPNPVGSLLNGGHDSAREIALDAQVPLHQKRVHRPVRQKDIAVDAVVTR